MHPSTCRGFGAEPTDQTLLGRRCKSPWQEGGTHRYARLMSAESELGKLPVSALLLRPLHTRSGLGRSAVLRRTHSNDVPLQYPRIVPVGRVPLENSLVTSRARGPILRVPQQPCCRTVPFDAPDMHPSTCRALGAEPTDPTLLGRTRKRPWQEEGTHSDSRLMSAESELGKLPVSAFWPRPLDSRSGLGPLGGTTPHPQQRCAPTVPTHCTHRRAAP
jgi:hypothetical protein